MPHGGTAAAAAAAPQHHAAQRAVSLSRPSVSIPHRAPAAARSTRRVPVATPGRDPLRLIPSYGTAPLNMDTADLNGDMYELPAHHVRRARARSWAVGCEARACQC